MLCVLTSLTDFDRESFILYYKCYFKCRLKLFPTSSLISLCMKCHNITYYDQIYYLITY